MKGYFFEFGHLFFFLSVEGRITPLPQDVHILIPGDRMIDLDVERLLWVLLAQRHWEDPYKEGGTNV